MSWLSKLFRTNKSETAEKQQEQPASAIGDDYAGKCLVENYKEEDESRSWDSDPAFQKALDPLNAGQNSKARDEAAALSQKFPDFAEVYRWWAKALLNDDKYNEARSVLWDALCKCKQKYPLLNLMGEVEWKAGTLLDAVYWWVQGLICQETRKNFGGEVGAYLYLFHVTEILNLSSLATDLRERVDFITPGKIRLSPDAVDNLANLARTTDTTEMSRTLELLEKNYFAPQTQLNTSSHNDEVPRLIRLAQDENAEYDARAKAIEKLVEIGDSRAIRPLMRICQDDLTVISFDAEDAVDKIRARGK